MRPPLLQNPHRSEQAFAVPSQLPLAFHQTVPGYAPTALISLEALAAELGAGAILAKVEHPRFGLPAFKVLGASWAIARALGQWSGRPVGTWDELLAVARARGPLCLTAATAGNHGRAVARIAALLGIESRIFVPSTISDEQRLAIEAEGAKVERVAGNYDFAVRTALGAASAHCLLISDVMVEGEDPVPRWVIEGYSTLLWEVEAALDPGPDLVMVQLGVGALAAAVVRHFRRPQARRPVRIVGVEPLGAACVLESVRRGTPVTLTATPESAMGGLNTQAPTLAAWPELLYGIDAFVAIEDEPAFGAMRALAAAGVEAGASGAAGLGGLIAAGGAGGLGLPPNPRVLVVVTEGATDRAAYARVIRPPLT